MRTRRLVGLLFTAMLVAVSPVRAQVASPVAIPAATPVAVELVPFTDEGYGFSSVIPSGWTELGQGIFARQQSATDPVVIAQQSAPLRPDAVLTMLLPQLALTEAPEPTGTHQGAALEWTLYQIDVAAGSVELRVDLALAGMPGTTYIVLLQTSPDEYETLHAQVFLPTINALTPLEPVATPVSYIVEEVTFTSGDVTLAGTLTLPPGEGPFPAVVLVSGSGPQDRDESLGGIAIKPFLLLADSLTNAGVAVLRYDDRGVGLSTGDFAAATIPDFAADAEAALTYLVSREEIDADKLGLLGHSEGGLVAAMLGARNDELDFIISLAGPGVDGRQVLMLQNQRIMEAEGATQEQIDAQLAFLEELFTVLDDPAAIEQLVYENALSQAQALPEAERAALGDLEDYARQIAAQSAAQYDDAWFASFLAYDPAADWAQTTVPVLAIFGEKDVQVDAKQNAPAVEAALAEAGNDAVTIVVLPGANHLFQAADTGGISEYATLPAEFTPELMPTILEWLEDDLGVIDEELSAAGAPPGLIA